MCGRSGPRQDLRQPVSRRPPSPRARSRGVAAFERAAPGGVALEVGGVDLDALERAAPSQLGRSPSRGPARAAASSPSRRPCRRRAGHDQVVAVAEEHVAAGDDQAAVLHRREVDLAGGRTSRGQSGSDLAVDAQPRDAAVREDVEPQVGDAARCPFRIGNRFLAVALERRARQDLDARRLAVSSAGARMPVDRAGVERAGFGIVAAEEAGVDDHAARARRAGRGGRWHQSWPGLAAAAGLPAVHPLAASVYSPAMNTGRPALSRFSFGAKNSSFAASTAPPRRSAARSTRSVKSFIVLRAGSVGRSASRGASPHRRPSRRAGS